jgi:hypothetical protein
MSSFLLQLHFIIQDVVILYLFYSDFKVTLANILDSRSIIYLGKSVNLMHD